jgi:hypothetical protein
MQKFSNKVQTDPQQMSYQYNGEGQKSQSQLQQDYSWSTCIYMLFLVNLSIYLKVEGFDFLLNNKPA